MIVLPRMPAGADLNPLDAFVNDSVKNALKGEDVSTVNLLKKETAIAIAKLQADKVRMDAVAKTCRAFPKRVAWVANNAGRKVVRSLVNKE